MLPAQQQSPNPGTDPITQFRTVRLVHFLIFGAALLQIYILYYLTANRPAPKPVKPVLDYVFLAVGLVEFIVALVIRSVLSIKVRDLCQSNTMNSKALMLWRAVSIVSTCFAYSIFLFGWVLAFIGGLHRTTILLWSVSAIAFFVFIPKSPIDESTELNLPPGGQQ